MKKIGVVIGIICAIITAISILGIITANRGKVESIDQDQLRELNLFSELPFPDEVAEDKLVSHPKSDSLVQVLKKKADDTLTGRLRTLEALTTKYEAMEAEMVRAGGKRFTPEFETELNEKFVEEAASYGVTSSITKLTTWEKFSLFAVTWRSVMLIFGFLGMGLGIAIASSGTFRSDLDDQN